MRVKAFLFDIGGVLLNYDLPALARMISGGSPAAMERVMSLRTHPSLYDVETGRISGERYFAEQIQPLIPHWTYADLIQAWVDIFSPNENGMQLLRDVQARGYPVYLLSNLAKFNADAIERKWPGLIGGVSGRLFSYEMGHMKPDPQIYIESCRRIGAAPAECLFLDDTLECVEGARRVGMVAMHFTVERFSAIRKDIGEAIGGW